MAARRVRISRPMLMYTRSLLDFDADCVEVKVCLLVERIDIFICFRLVVGLAARDVLSPLLCRSDVRINAVVFIPPVCNVTVTRGQRCSTVNNGRSTRISPVGKHIRLSASIDCCLHCQFERIEGLRFDWRSCTEEEY